MADAYWIEDRIQTESGLDLTTESGVPLIRGIIGISGYGAAHGAAGTVAATGTIRAARPSDYGGWRKPVPITRILFGTVAAQGATGVAQAAATLRLKGTAQLKSAASRTDLIGSLRLVADGQAV